MNRPVKPSRKSPRTSTRLAILLVIVVMLPGFGAGNHAVRAQETHNPSSTVSVTLDGVDVLIRAVSFPSAGFILPEPGASDQIASSVSWNPFRELSITAIPFGHKPGTETLPAAAAGGWRGYMAALRNYRVQQAGKVQDGPTATLFGRQVTAIHTVTDLFVDGPIRKPVAIDEWVVEAGSRLWLVRASQEQAVDEPDAQSADFASHLSIDSQTLGNPSRIAKAGTAAPMQAPTPNASTANLPAPAWWNGDCDATTYSQGSGGIASYRLGAVYLGMPACGPRPFADHGPDVLVRFFPGAWGEYEWECVELTMRFLYLMYGIPPYQANGSQAVWNYGGSRLVKVANGTVGQAPQPNDVLSYGSTSTFGHASVVTASSVNASGNGTITVIEENNSSSGSSTLSVSNWLVSGNAGAVSGWLHDGNVGLGDIRVDIAGTLAGSYNVPPGGNSSPNFPGAFSGPVHVASATGQTFFTSERQIYGSSFAETMGIPGNRLTTDYWFPWYDGVYMQTWVSIGAPESNTGNALVDIYIGGSKMNANSYSIAPGGEVSPNFPGTFNGPVHVVSNNGQSIFTTERQIYGSSFSESAGIAGNRLTTDYWFPWYDGQYMQTWVSIGVPNTDTAKALVNIYIGGNNMTPYSYWVPPGGQQTASFAGTFNGPVHVVSLNGQAIFASERQIYGSSFSESMGVPGNELTTDYWFPWYDGQYMQTWISIGAPDTNTQPASVDIYIGGTKMNSTSYSIPPGGQLSPNFPGAFAGPVHVVSTNGQNIFTTERQIYGSSFAEAMGTPNNQLTTDYWFPWYDGRYMQTWVSISKP